MDFLFAAPNGTAAFPQAQYRTARDRLPVPNEH
jgi:hypothetical protein